MTINNVFKFFNVLTINVTQMKINIHWLLFLLVIASVSCTNQNASLVDWPQYKKDNFRSGASPVNIDLGNLDLSWTYVASQVPVPALRISIVSAGKNR